MRFFSACILALVALCCLASARPDHALATPALPFATTVTEPDGASLTVIQKGDEHQNRVETRDGFTVGRHSDGYWYYVEGYKGSEPVLSSTRAHKKAPSQIKKGLRQEASSLRAGSASISAAEVGGAPSFANFSGHLLIILVSFTNKAGTYTEADYADYLMKISNYYNTVSYGNAKLSPAAETYGTANNGVVGWLNVGYAHPNTGSGWGAKNQQLAYDAVMAASSYVDFAAYDTNQDGYVDSSELGILVVAAGYESSYTPGASPGIWAHASCLSPAPAINGVTVGGCGKGLAFAEMGELHSTHINTLGTGVHELGHAIFQFPDLYDVDGSSKGIGNYGVMSYGCWGYSNADSFAGQTPVLPSAYTKYRAGWILPSKARGTLTLTATGDPASTATNSAAIFNGTTGNEFFLMENRGDYGYDRGLERLFGVFKGGLAVWHVDTNKSSNTTECYPTSNCSSTHLMVALEQADGKWDIDKSVNYGDSGDLYPGIQNTTTFSSTTTPNSNLYSGAASGLAIRAVSPASTAMTVSFTDFTAPVTRATSTGYTFGSWSGNGSLAVVLTASDNVAVAAGYPKYCVDTANACTPATSYAGPVTVACASGLCTQYIRYLARDTSGNTEAVKSSLIKQDRQAPTTTAAGFAAGVWNSAASVTMTLGATDGAGSGMAAGYPKYCLDTDNTCTPATTYSGAFSASCAADTTCKQYARYYSVDASGNAEAVKVATILQDRTKPSGVLVIKGGAGFTNSVKVALTLSGTDDKRIAGFYKSNLSNTPAAGAAGWIATSPAASVTNTVNHSLLAGNGTKAVYAWYKDSAGNVSPVITNTIVLDVTPPAGSVTINGGSSITNSISVTLTLSASDNNLVAGYYKSNLSNTPLANAAGWVAVPQGASYSNTISHNLPRGSGLKTVYVWYRDFLGNISRAFSNTIMLDSTPPTGSLVINNLKTLTNSPSVTLTLTASDANKVAGYFASNINSPLPASDPGWTPIDPATSVTLWSPHTLSSGSGLKTVYVWYKDTLDNVSAAIKNTITLDTVAPTGEVIINNGAQYTGGTNVSLTLKASDAYKVAGYYKSNSAEAPLAATPGWVTVTKATVMVNTVSHAIPSDPGMATVHVWFKDAGGNISADITNTITLDTSPPAGTLVVKGGAAFSNSVKVVLTLNGADDNRMAGFYKSNIGNTPSASAPGWIATSASASVTNTVNHSLAAGTGTKTVYAWYKDAAGNVSPVISNTIVLDVTPPTGSVTINGGSTITNSPSVTLALNASDNNNVAGYYASNLAAPPLSNAAGWVMVPQAAIFSDTISHTLTAGSGLKTVYVWYMDFLGNVSATLTNTVTLDVTPPTGSVAINNGVSLTNSPSVKLKLSASDTGNVAGYFKSNTNTPPLASDPGWTDVTPATTFAATVNHTVAAGSGSRTVYVWYKDALGNVSTAFGNSITLDTVAPTGVVVINNGAQITNSTSLSLTLKSADVYKVAGYYKSNAGTAPLADTAGWVAVAQATSVINTVTHAVAAGSGQKTVHVWFKDVAGNISPDISNSITLDTSPPAGSFTIDSDAAFTNSANVTLSLRASDATRVAGYYKSNTSAAPLASASGWVALTQAPEIAATVSHALTAGSGVKTVYVWFKDNFGYVSAAVTNTITCDITPPLDGSLTVTPGSGMATISMSGFSDSGIGLEGYKIAYSNASTPESCSAAQLLSVSPNLDHTGLGMGETYYYRVCGVDYLGNESSGATSTVTIAADPVGAWTVHALEADAGKWVSANVTVDANGALACDTFSDGLGGTDCAALNMPGVINLLPDGTLYIPSTDGGGAINMGKNKLVLLRTYGASEHGLALMTRAGGAFDVTQLDGVWLAHGLNAEPGYVKTYGFTQDIDTGGNAACLNYLDSTSSTDCDLWGIESYGIDPSGAVSGIITTGTGVMDESRARMTVVRNAPTGGYELAVLTLSGSVFAQADMTGVWAGYGLTVNAVAPQWFFFRQTVDSAGLASCTSYGDSSGVTDCGLFNGVTYVLNADGTLGGLGTGVMHADKDSATLMREDGLGGHSLIVLHKLQ